MINYEVGSYISGFRKEKQELRDAERRLLMAFVAVLTIATMYGYVAIQFACASDYFIPTT